MHHHHLHGGFGGFGYPLLGGLGMGMGGGLLRDLLAGGLGYYLGSRSAQRNQPYAAPVPSSNTLTQLKLLGQLRESGILTEEEFQQQKQRILNGF